MDIIELKSDNRRDIIQKTKQVLSNGGLVIFPSDTVYGLLVNAANEQAVNKLIAFKNRPIGKAISIFVSNLTMLKRYVNVTEEQTLLLQELLPGPFTIVLTSYHKTSHILESEKGTLGVRIPDYSLVKELVQEFGKPVTATSANLGGRSPHYSIESLLHELPKTKQVLIDLIVDAGKLPRNKPSTVLDFSQSEVRILRKGDIIWKDQLTYKSLSTSQTKKIAEHILDKNSIKAKAKPLIIILKGELGAGKTVFVKGLAERLGIKNIISPTFVIYYEYPISGNKHIKNLYHFDLYNIEEKEEFQHLGINELLKPGNLLAFEWGEKTGEIYDFLKEKAEILFIELKYINEKEREVSIRY